MGRPGRNPCSIASIESDTPSRHGETRKREQRGHEGYSVEPWPALDHHAIEPRAERCNYGEVLRDAAIAGLGIAMHSTWHVGEELRNGRLAIVLPQWRIPDSAIQADMPKRRLVPLRVRAFADFLVERLGDDLPWERAATAD